MTESFLSELKRYVRFGAEDGDALRAFAATARPHFGRIIDEFYSRLHEHEAARAVFDGPEQVNRLKVTLGEWLDLLFTGPWDDAYYERRARIGRVHVRIRLPQKYMFGAMDLIRIELVTIVEGAALSDASRVQVVRALHKIIDIELAIMLETYGETYVQQVQELEKLARKDLEQRLALSEARYDEVVEKGEALTVTFEPSGRMILFNRRAEEITGIDRGVATQRYWFDIFCAPSDRDLVRRSMDAVLAGKRVPPYEGPVLAPSGAERRVRWHFTTLPGTQGQILCAIGVDVTEERELATRTRRAERLAALGTMAAGLAHEIRNPLNAAHIQLTLAQRRIARHAAEAPEGVKVALDLAGSEMKRLAVLVEDFLQFARPQPPRLAFVDLRATAEVTVALVAPEAAALGVELSLEPGEPLRLEFDDEKMKQVILNLLRNAIEAAAPGGHVLVRVRVKDDQGCLCVEDDGRGLPADAPIFEPFFTTKETGTGLGLAIVHRIVADHAGHIDCESRPGRTVFSVCLPMTATPPAEGVPGTPRAQ